MNTCHGLFWRHFLAFTLQTLVVSDTCISCSDDPFSSSLYHNLVLEPAMAEPTGISDMTWTILASWLSEQENTGKLSFNMSSC